jgi:hypothetical protein
MPIVEPQRRLLPESFTVLSLDVPDQRMHPRGNYLLSIRLLITAPREEHSYPIPFFSTIINNDKYLSEEDRKFKMYVHMSTDTIQSSQKV